MPKPRHRFPSGMLAFVALLALLAAPVALAQPADEPPPDPANDTEVSVELSLATDDEEDRAAAGPWYDNPTLIAILGVGALVILVLAVMAVRESRGDRTSAA